MSYKYSYAREKFNRAVYSLATGKDEIRRRLLPIFQGDLLCITPRHLPPNLQEDYRWIMRQVTKFDEKYQGDNRHFKSNDGRYDHLIPTKLEATLFRIRRNTGAKVAVKIFDICSSLNEESRDYFIPKHHHNNVQGSNRR